MFICSYVQMFRFGELGIWGFLIWVFGDSGFVDLGNFVIWVLSTPIHLYTPPPSTSYHLLLSTSSYSPPPIHLVLNHLLLSLKVLQWYTSG